MKKDRIRSFMITGTERDEEKKGGAERLQDWEELKNWGQLMREEDGMGTVEIILIIVVLVGLVLIFKEKITEIVESIFSKITKQTNKF